MILCISEVDNALQLISVKDKFLSPTSPAIQNPIPQSINKPLVVASSPSQPSTKLPTPATSTAITTTTTKFSSRVSNRVVLVMNDLHNYYRVIPLQAVVVV